MKLVWTTWSNQEIQANCLAIEAMEKYHIEKVCHTFRCIINSMLMVARILLNTSREKSAIPDIPTITGESYKETV